MTGISQLILLGRVAEIDILTTKNGKPWTRVTLEIKTYRRTTEGEAQDEKTMLPVNLFSRLAETANQHLKVGDAVAVTARANGTEYKDKQTGTTKRGVSLVGDVLHLLPNGRAAKREGALL
jgi:single-stranded DNA-binding protein